MLFFSVFICTPFHLFDLSQSQHQYQILIQDLIQKPFSKLHESCSLNRPDCMCPSYIFGSWEANKSAVQSGGHPVLLGPSYYPEGLQE